MANTESQLDVEIVPVKELFKVSSRTMSATVHTYGSCVTFLSDQRVATFRRNMPTVAPAPVENASQGRIGGQRRHQTKARMANNCAATSSTFARSGAASGRRSLRRCDPELRGRPGPGGPARTSRSEVDRPADVRRTGVLDGCPLQSHGHRPRSTPARAHDLRCAVQRAICAGAHQPPTRRRRRRPVSRWDSHRHQRSGLLPGNLRTPRRNTPNPADAKDIRHLSSCSHLMAPPRLAVACAHKD